MLNPVLKVNKHQRPQWISPMPRIENKININFFEQFEVTIKEGCLIPRAYPSFQKQHYTRKEITNRFLFIFYWPKRAEQN